MQAASYADARVNVNTFPFWRQSRGPNLLYSHTMLRDSADTMGSHLFLHAENQLAYTTWYCLPGDFLFLLETRAENSLTNSEEVSASLSVGGSEASSDLFR